MDFREFRSGKVWIPIAFGPDDGPMAEFKVAYCPAALTDEDAEFLAQLEHVRLIEFQGLYEQPADEPPAENRAQKRARERAEERAAAVPERARKRLTDRPTVIDFMKRLVVDWDLTWGIDDKGEPVPWPVCEDSFRQMEHSLRFDIVTSIMWDYLERPNLGSLSKRLSARTKESGPTGQTSAPEPSSGGVVPFPGTSQADQTGDDARSGTTG